MNQTAAARSVVAACKSCRRRKCKCSGEQPCKQCIAGLLICEYPEVHKRGAVMQSQQLLDIEVRIEKLKSILIQHVPEALEMLDGGIREIPETSKSIEGRGKKKNLLFKQDSNFLLINGGSCDALRYLGFTTDIHIDIFKQTQRHQAGFLSIPSSRFGKQAAPFQHSPPCSDEIHTTLATIFFNSIHQYYPFLDRRAYFHNLSTNNQPEFTLLKYAVSAVVAQVACKVDGLEETPFALSKELIRLVKAELPAQYDGCTIKTVQTCILLAMCGMASPETINSYVYTSNSNLCLIEALAINFCVELGMHRDIDTLTGTHTTLSPTFVELRKRAWFCAVILDIHVSMHQGRPVHVRFEDWNTPFPDWEFEPLIQSNYKVDGEAFTALVKSSSLVARISDVIHGIGISGRDTLLDERLAGLKFLFAGLSPRIVSVMSGLVRAPWGLIHNAGLVYHCGCLLAYRASGEPYLFLDINLKQRYPEQHLDQLKLILMQRPHMTLGLFPQSTEVYLSPLFTYATGTILSCYIQEPLTSTRLTHLFHLVLLQSHLEETYSCAFKYRLLVREFLESKMYNAEAILGPLLCTRFPIGVTDRDLFDLYSTFTRDHSVFEKCINE